MPELKQYPPKLECLDNKEYSVTFKFDEPKVSIGKEGTTFAGQTSWIYRVDLNGIEHTLFVNDARLHDILVAAKVRKGTQATLSINQESGDKKKKYWLLLTADGDAFDSRNVRTEPKPAAKKEPFPAENPIKVTPSIDDLIFTYNSIIGKMVMQFDKTKTGLEKRLNIKINFPVEEFLKTYRETFTTLFIEARKNGLVIAEGSVRDQMPDKPKPVQDDLPEGFEDAVAKDDIPF